ncbi:MAG: hypothetical protein J6R82_03315 [Clostridia bacterium]|nr:hypothetical protein [Clostridia bacterium]
MKKFALVLLSIVLCATMSVLSVSADAVMGTWTKVSDTEYSVENHQNGNDYFDYYELGKSDMVTLSADMVATDNSQQSFFVGVVDVNGDGQIREFGDQYYLVHFNGTRLALERNDKAWGGFAREGIDSGVALGETCTIKVTYTKGTINVYANGELKIEYADTNTWDNGGTGFGLASKSGPKVTFSNVSVDTETPVKNTTNGLTAGSIDVENAENNAMWTVEGNKYTLNIATPAEGYGNARFASYALGNSDKKVTLTTKFAFPEFSKWGNDNGGDNGFLFAIADKNGDGMISESGDFYYLVDVRTDGSVAIEKNQGGWGGWSAESAKLNLAVGTEYVVSASYDPATGTIVVTVDGEEVLNWTDSNPMLGTGYALASKTPNFVMSDVAVVAEGDETPVDPPAIEDPVDPPKTEDPVNPPVDDKPTTDAPTTNVPTIGETPTDEAPDEGSPVVIIVIVAVVVVVAAVVVFLVVKKKK